MEINSLQAFVLTMVLVGMILGVGVLVLDKFSGATKDAITLTNESITVTSSTASVVYPNVASVAYFGNSTVTGTITNNVNWTEQGVVSVSSSTFKDGTYNISYVGQSNTTSSNTLASTVGAITPISTTWLGLIVTIAVLAIILTLVIRSFTLRQ